MKKLTQAKKLEAVVHKALDSGFSWHKYMDSLPKDVEIEWWIEDEENPDDAFITLIDKDQGQHSWRVEISREQMLFNKDLARALFGEDEVDVLELSPIGGRHEYVVSAFEYHLMQAVISDDPIDYYYREVFKDNAKDEVQI